MRTVCQALASLSRKGESLKHQCYVPCAQIYDQIYLDSLAAKAGFPFVATNYTSPILHSVELPRLKPSTTYGPTSLTFLY